MRQGNLNPRASDDRTLANLGIRGRSASPSERIIRRKESATVVLWMHWVFVSPGSGAFAVASGFCRWQRPFNRPYTFWTRKCAARPPPHAKTPREDAGRAFGHASSRILPHLDDRLDGLARSGILERLVDILEVIVLHQLVEREAALAVVLDQLGNEQLGHGVALYDARHRLSLRHDLAEHVDGHLGRDAHDGHGAQRAQRGQALVDDRGDAGRLDRVMGARPRRLPYLLDHVHLGAVEGIVGAQLARQLEAALVHVDRDDGPASRDLRRHDGAKPHRAAAVHDDRGAERGLEAGEHRPAARLDAAAQGAEQLQLHVIGHLHHVALVGDGVGGKGGLPEERGHRPPVLLQALDSLGAEVQVVHLLARGGMGGQAVFAMAARGIREHHMVSRPDGLHVLARLLDNAGALVPEDDRVRHDAVVPGDGIRMADARRHHPHQNLVGAGFSQLDFPDLEFLALAVGNGGLDLHVRSSLVLLDSLAHHARPRAEHGRSRAANRRHRASLRTHATANGEAAAVSGRALGGGARRLEGLVRLQLAQAAPLRRQEGHHEQRGRDVGDRRREEQALQRRPGQHERQHVGARQEQRDEEQYLAREREQRRLERLPGGVEVVRADERHGQDGYEHEVGDEGPRRGVQVSLRQAEQVRVHIGQEEHGEPQGRGDGDAQEDALPQRALHAPELARAVVAVSYTHLSALDWGSRGREFKSRHSDHRKSL